MIKLPRLYQLRRKLQTYIDHANSGGIGPAGVLRRMLIIASAPQPGNRRPHHTAAAPAGHTAHRNLHPRNRRRPPRDRTTRRNQEAPPCNRSPFEQLNALPTTTDLITAARALRIGRTKAYELARAGTFPVRIIRVGTGYHVPTSELLKVLGVTPLRRPTLVPPTSR